MLIPAKQEDYKNDLRPWAMHRFHLGLAGFEADQCAWSAPIKEVDVGSINKFN